ncbi:unnamed protein product [Danaus chrysippus]|uniref:(African queen) hypothetical protein n=1 Tax=Danaus chrysippus TaxID=151541 RepID=A0A8J2QZ04_9NEOP|nr:unnamed protein product [Danaus chrysippus]
MKLQVFAVLFVVASAFALPYEGDDVIVVESNDELSQRNPVEDSIRRAVERISAGIKNAGLDPLEVQNREFEFIPITIDLVIRAFIENLQFYGLSDISIDVLEYSYIFNRLRIVISLPEVALSIGDSNLDALVIGFPIKAGLKGSASVKAIRLAGELYVNFDIIGGVSLRSLSLNFSLGGIDSDLGVVLQGSDRSEVVNDFLSKRIPNFIENNKNDINNVLETVVSIILNYIWIEMRTLYLFVLFLGFSKASTQQSIIDIDDVKFKETIDKLDLNSIKSTLTEELKDVLSQYNVEQLKEELATSNIEKNGPIESVILELLERFRQIMRNGTDSLPVLDPIVIKQISLGDKTIPSSSYVLINDLVIKDISTFEVEKLQLSTVWFRPRLDFDFVIPAVSVNTSSYDLFFNVFGGNIYGKGDMRLVIDKPRIFGHFILGVRVTLEGIFLRIEECRIQIGLEAFRPIITGMFGDQAISDFIAAFLRNLIPEMLEFFEKDIADTLSLVVQFVGNLILAEVNIGDLLPIS